MDLINAIKDNNLNKIEELILNGSCIYTPDSDLSTPLHHALLLRNFVAINLLLEGYERDYSVLHKIDGNLIQTAYVAFTEEQIGQVLDITESTESDFSSSDSEDYESVDKVLLYDYENPEAVFVKFTDRDSMLKQSLLKNGCYDLNAVNNDSLNYIYASATLRRLEIFRRLSKLGADYTLRVANNTCLHIAASRGCNEIVEELLRKRNIDIHSRGGDDHTPLLKAGISGNVNVFNAILDKITKNKNPDEVTAEILLKDKNHFVEIMQYAILHDYGEMVKRLFEFGVNPEIKSAVSGYSSILWAVECDNISALLLLTKNGINWKDPEKDFKGAMDIAKQRNYKDMVDVLQGYF